MKIYKYVRCDELYEYKGWELVQVIPHEDCDMCIISKIQITIM